jgi:hypothetical protein
MVRALAIFFACTTLGLAVLVAWLVAPQFRRVSQEVRADEDIAFPMKLFVGERAFVAAKGTLTADWIAYKNNTFSISCDSTECIVASIDQIGPKQVGEIDGPMIYPLKSWSEEDKVVAEGQTLCSRITITLDRKSETVLWVETPINQTAIECKNADSQVRKATLEASLFWRRRRERTSNW